MVDRPLSQAELDEVATIRHRIHQGQKSHRPLSEDYERIGLAGERALSEYLNLPIDRSIRIEGSGSVNFTTEDGTTINVYCARNPVHLLVERRKAKADIYVLGLFLPVSGAAVLIGWATREEVIAVDPKDIGGMGVMSHYIPHTKLRKMYELPSHLGIDIRR